MAAGVTILHKRKAGAFLANELQAGEFGVDITNGDIYFSTIGTDVIQIDPSGTGTVTTTGTTTDGQIAVFTGQDDIESTAALVFDGTDLTVGTNKVLDAGDTTVGTAAWVLDEDNLVSDDATKVPTQQSVKAYVDAAVTSQVTYQGAYDASTTSPTATSVGEMYTVTVGGTGGSYFTATLEVGDVIISESASPASETDWTVVQKNESGVATTADTLAQFAATTSAELAGVISDETGSAGGGVLVFSNSPTLTTPSLTLETGTTPTSEGAIQWDGTNDQIVVGDGAGTKVFEASADITTLTNLSITESQISNLGTAITLETDINTYAGLNTIVADQTLATTTSTQTFTNKTLTSPVLTSPEINDTSADHQYIFGVSELDGDRTVTLPVLAGNDIFVFEAHTQTLSNKTISDDGSTIDGGLIT